MIMVRLLVVYENTRNLGDRDSRPRYTLWSASRGYRAGRLVWFPGRIVEQLTAP